MLLSLSYIQILSSAHAETYFPEIKRKLLQISTNFISIQVTHYQKFSQISFSIKLQIQEV
jgi:hypothetical protein